MGQIFAEVRASLRIGESFGDLGVGDRCSASLSLLNTYVSWCTTPDRWSEREDNNPLIFKSLDFSSDVFGRDIHDSFSPIYLKPLACLYNLSGNSSGHDAGDSVFSGDDGAVSGASADLRHYSSAEWEENRPSGTGGNRNQNLSLLEGSEFL